MAAFCQAATASGCTSIFPCAARLMSAVVNAEMLERSPGSLEFIADASAARMFCCVGFRPVNVLSGSAAAPPLYSWMAFAAAVIVAAGSPKTGMVPATSRICAPALARFSTLLMTLLTWSSSPLATPAVDASEPRLSFGVRSGFELSASNPPRPPSSGACAILLALWFALEYACCSRLVFSSRSST